MGRKARLTTEWGRALRSARTASMWDTRRISATNGERGAQRSPRLAIEERESEPYENVGDKGVSFSADSRHYAFSAQLDGKWFVVVDGVAGKGYDRLADSSVVFSTSGRPLALAGSPGGGE